MSDHWSIKVITVLEENGFYFDGQEGSHKSYK